MKMPPPPMLRLHQRLEGRFWDTEEVMELLSIYHGAPQAVYPKTWQYRALISVHRANDLKNSYRKGYGPDWKCLKRVEADGKATWIRDRGFAIKDDLLVYLRQGRVPYQAVQLAAVEIRKAEFAIWVHARVERKTGKKVLPITAE